MGVAADSAHGDPFALDVLGFLDVAARDDALGHDVFDPADKHQVGRSLDVTAHVADAPGQCHFCIATEYRRRDHTRRCDEDELVIKVVFLEETRLLRDPRHGLGHDSRGMNRNEFIRRRGQTGSAAQDEKGGNQHSHEH